MGGPEPAIKAVARAPRPALAFWGVSGWVVAWLPSLQRSDLLLFLLLRQRDARSGAPQVRDVTTPLPTMPNFSGNWKIIRSENFEDLLKVLGKAA